ncbi:MAG: hypothetical protein RIA65_13405, partial [Woeseia sp.]
MSNSSIPGFDIDWTSLYDKFQSIGVDFGISLITAIVIFFVGRFIARVMARGLRKHAIQANRDDIAEG